MSSKLISLNLFTSSLHQLLPSIQKEIMLGLELFYLFSCLLIPSIDLSVYYINVVLWSEGSNKDICYL